jgi:hypothetical protein
VKKWKLIIALVEEAVDEGHAVVFGAVVAGRMTVVEGVVYGGVVVETAEGVAASREVRRKDAGKAPQPAGPSYFLYLPPLAAPDTALSGPGVGSTNLAPIRVASMARTSFASLPGSAQPR